MASAAQNIAELEAAGVPTHRPAIQQLAARRALETLGYDIKAYIRALPVGEQVSLIYSMVADADAPLSEFYDSSRIGEACQAIRDELAEEAAKAADRGCL